MSSRAVHQLQPAVLPVIVSNQTTGNIPYLGNASLPPDAFDWRQVRSGLYRFVLSHVDGDADVTAWSGGFFLFLDVPALTMVWSDGLDDGTWIFQTASYRSFGHDCKRVSDTWSFDSEVRGWSSAELRHTDIGPDSDNGTVIGFSGGPIWSAGCVASNTTAEIDLREVRDGGETGQRRQLQLEGFRLTEHECLAQYTFSYTVVEFVSLDRIHRTNSFYPTRLPAACSVESVPVCQRRPLQCY
jgi:hypothetical protein